MINLEPSPYLKKQYNVQLRNYVIALACIFIIGWIPSFMRHYSIKGLSLLWYLQFISILIVTFRFIYYYGEQKRDKANHFATGIRSEQYVAKVLEPIDGIGIFRNIELGNHGDIDCVVVDSSGVYSLEIKTHFIIFNFRKDLKQAKRNAGELQKYLASEGFNIKWIQPVLVYVESSKSINFGKNHQGQVKVIHADELRNLFNIKSEYLFADSEFTSICESIEKVSKA